jgi:hypothetical protein
MSIKSSAFGRVVLTDADAKKFKAQVTYGRPKAAAKRNVEDGIKLSDDLRQAGSIRFQLKELA